MSKLNCNPTAKWGMDASAVAVGDFAWQPGDRVNYFRLFVTTSDFHRHDYCIGRCQAQRLLINVQTKY